MDTLTTPVLLRCMVTNSVKASVEKGRQYTELVLVGQPAELIYASQPPEAEVISP
jgi:hypothetical protein